jgi:hypothetical protein
VRSALAKHRKQYLQISIYYHINILNVFSHSISYLKLAKWFQTFPLVSMQSFHLGLAFLAPTIYSSISTYYFDHALLKVLLPTCTLYLLVWALNCTKLDMISSLVDPKETRSHIFLFFASAYSLWAFVSHKQLFKLRLLLIFVANRAMVFKVFHLSDHSISKFNQRLIDHLITHQGLFQLFWIRMEYPCTVNML